MLVLEDESGEVQQLEDDILPVISVDNNVQILEGAAESYYGVLLLDITPT